MSSYSDEIIENLIFNYFKMINIDQVAFKKILDENEEKQSLKIILQQYLM